MANACQGDGRLQVGAAHRAHEVDDRHDHQARRDDLHAQRNRSAALGTDDIGTGRDDDEKEGTPGLREQAPPLKGGLEEIGRNRCL